MNNSITEKYFDHENFANHEQRVLAEIAAKTNFQAEKEIFRGQIYDKDKVGSLIYRGIWQNQPAVLKIQGLKPEIDEIDLYERFNSKNQSTKIRLPKLLDSSKWNANNGYGFLIMEFVDAPQIYQQPFANAEQIQDFCAFYQEYKSNCLREALLEQDPLEASSLIFSAQRVLHWQKIAQSKWHLTEEAVKIIEKYLALAGQHLPSVKMEFMHGHFGYNDIFKLSENEYVIMSNLFWSYRPEFYDATFHLWCAIKSIRDQNIDAPQIIEYLQKWLEEYKKLPVISQDPDFERKFAIMMAERCIGAILVDIPNQNYENDRNILIAHLTKIFQDLFEYFAKQLENNAIA